MELKNYIRDIPDFPQEGILFRDITPMLHDPAAYGKMIDTLCAQLDGIEVDYVVGPEARGFLLGAPMALKMGAGFVPVRKPGKLPYDTIKESYDLEYGSNTIEMHSDALKAGDRVVIVDDLLATGGTAAAACRLCEKMGAKVVAVSFAVELCDLKGREALKDYKVYSVLQY